MLWFEELVCYTSCEENNIMVHVAETVARLNQHYFQQCAVISLIYLYYSQRERHLLVVAITIYIEREGSLIIHLYSIDDRQEA